MPEISIMLFDLSQLFRLFPKEDKEFNEQIKKYEQEVEENMAQNRLKLFGE